MLTSGRLTLNFQTTLFFLISISFFSLQWMPQDLVAAPISSASFSCNSHLVYAAFFNGDIMVFDSDHLKPRCRIAPSAYISPTAANRCIAVHETRSSSSSSLSSLLPPIYSPAPFLHHCRHHHHHHYHSYCHHHIFTSTISSSLSSSSSSSLS